MQEIVLNLHKELFTVKTEFASKMEKIQLFFPDLQVLFQEPPTPVTADNLQFPEILQPQESTSLSTVVVQTPEKRPQNSQPENSLETKKVDEEKPRRRTRVKSLRKSEISRQRPLPQPQPKKRWVQSLRPSQGMDSQSSSEAVSESPKAVVPIGSRGTLRRLNILGEQKRESQSVLETQTTNENQQATTPSVVVETQVQSPPISAHAEPKSKVKPSKVENQQDDISLVNVEDINAALSDVAEAPAIPSRRPLGVHRIPVKTTTTDEQSPLCN